MTFSVDAASLALLVGAVLGLLLLAATLVGAGVTVGLSIAKSRHAARAAKILGVAALCLLAVGVFASASGVFASVVAAREPGLSQVDQQRLRSNGAAEAIYSLAITLLVAGPALLVAWRVSRRAA